MPQYVKLPNGKWFARYDYRTDGAYWTRVGRKPWWHGWMKLAAAALIVWLCWPLVQLLLTLGCMLMLLALLSVFLIPLNAFLDSGKPRRRACRHRHW